MPPGATKYNGHFVNIDIQIDYIEYSATHYKHESSSANGLILHPSIMDKVQWYDIRGLHDENVINSISKRFDMHPLAVEDAVDVHQRPSFTEYDKGQHISLKVLHFDKATAKVSREAVSIYFGTGFVISFQEREQDTLQPLKSRIEGSKGRIRSKNADYLAYTIVDFVVDNYFQVMDFFEEEIETLELTISENSDNFDKTRIYELKKELLKVRKSISPLREAINLFSRSESDFVEERTVAYIRDVYDHTIQIMDNVDSMRDILSGLQDLYISEISLRMNKIMQFLTIVTAVFVPLSFLTGLYGMNFDVIPELKYQNGYFVLWVFMILLVVGMLLYFKKKKWL